ncbi:hypothetical protein [Spirosoma fluviale]|uniref:Uncharacterized protein n=1 Tax=Spirosoma fluviale TaxID=1597977 RepID=A0A286FCU6_9BACT|nr:hypothetical protein [Spirosoma fluviale]SOD81067.1 hypothetical protein SAMN06269250_1663 [Spirosoma fluviale]
MSSIKCKCTHPDGGGTTCPPRHVAICIRGKDKQCYGECKPIPIEYNSVTFQFQKWLSDDIRKAVIEYIEDNYPINKDLMSFKRGPDLLLPDSDNLVYEVEGIGKIFVKINYEFR